MKYCLLALITALLAIVALTGCTIDNPAYALNPPGTPITVTVPGGISSDVTVVNTPLPIDLTQSDPYFAGIAEGEIAGHVAFYDIGYNGGVGTTEEDIWYGSSTYVFPVAAQQMRIFSSNAADNATGTGIKTVRIYYLTNTYAEATEDIELNGTSFVNTVATNILRVNALRALTAGTGYKAAGNIILEGLTGTDYRVIAAGYTRDRSGIYTVPAGKSLYITDYYVGVGGLNANNMCRITLRANYIDVAPGTLLTAGLMFMPFVELVVPNGDIVRHFDIPIYFPATADVKISAYVDAGTAFVEASYRGWTE